MRDARWIVVAGGALAAAVALWAWWPQAPGAHAALDQGATLEPPSPVPSARGMSTARADARGQAADSADEDPATRAYQAEFHRALAEALQRARAGTTARDRRDAVLLALILSNHGGDAGLALARRDQAARELAAAARAAPDDAVLAWLELECRGTRDCNRRDALARLQALDADNAMAWLADETLLQAGREQALDAALARAARAPRMRAPFDPLTLATRDTLERIALPQPPDSMVDAMVPGASRNGGLDIVRHVSALAVGSAYALPGLQTLSRGCAPPVPQQRRAVCHRVLELAAAEGSFLYEGLATTRMLTLTAGTPAAGEWRERYRQFEWRRERQGEAALDPAWLTLRMRLSERDAVDAWAQQRGHPTTPPPGWLPADPASRARLTGG